MSAKSLAELAVDRGGRCFERGCFPRFVGGTYLANRFRSLPARDAVGTIGAVTGLLGVLVGPSLADGIRLDALFRIVVFDYPWHVSLIPFLAKLLMGRLRRLGRFLLQFLVQDLDHMVAFALCASLPHQLQ